ncbi:MAG: glycosyltransferase family 4 protein [Verrucomicrobiia bacterium]
MKRPSFAVVCRSFGQPGGAENWARQQARALAATGRFDLHVVCAEEGRLEGPWQLHSVPTPRVTGFWHKWEFAWRVRRILERFRFDWVHTHDPVPGATFATTGPPQAFWAREVRGKRFPGLNDRVHMSLERRMFVHPRFQLALPMSRRVESEILGAYPMLKGKTRVITPLPEGPLPEENEVKRLRAEHRERLGLDEGERLILFVGNNFRLKGLQHVIDAMGEERQAGRLWRLVVVGRGDAAEFTRMARIFGVGEQVQFAGLESGSMLRWFAAADVLALPSKFETFGMVVPEAMRAGCAVMVTETVGAADLVQDGETGWVIRSGLEMAQALSIAWGADLRAMGEKARLRMSDGRSREALVAPLFEVIFGSK